MNVPITLITFQINMHHVGFMLVTTKTKKYFNEVKQQNIPCMAVSSVCKEITSTAVGVASPRAHGQATTCNQKTQINEKWNFF